MCRSHADGGRLCPSQTDPVLIANRNARRRAAYAKKKQARFESVPSSFQTTAYKNPLLDKLTREELIERGYISAVQNSGVIDYTKLNGKSYKEFGFQSPKEKRINKMPLDEIREKSEIEMSGWSTIERKSAKTFTSNAYKWINRALYNKDENTPALRERPDDYVSPYNDELNPEGPKNHANPKDDLGPTVTGSSRPEFFKDFTSKLDTALAEKPLGEQRILYRGMGPWHDAFNGYDADVSQYVDDNYSLGQEVKFDGYQSASYSVGIAATYAGDEGILFEIKSASGINVTNSSAFTREAEVIFPRDARYMIVGIHKNTRFKFEDACTDDNSPRDDVTIVQLIEITEQGAVRDSSNIEMPAPLTKTQLATAPFDDDTW
jgi:hypothetical protein